MKINEPKTPFAKHYDPAEDEEEIRRLEAEERAGIQRTPSKSKAKFLRTREEDIPDIELGEPEQSRINRPLQSPKQVIVKDTEGYFDQPGEDVEEEEVEEDEEEKHRKFMEMRKRHYEMKAVKDLLAYVAPRIRFTGDGF